MKDCQNCQWDYKGTCYIEGDCNFTVSYSTLDKFLIWLGSKFVGMGIGKRFCSDRMRFADNSLTMFDDARNN